MEKGKLTLFMDYYYFLIYFGFCFGGGTFFFFKFYYYYPNINSFVNLNSCNVVTGCD